MSLFNTYSNIYLPQDIILPTEVGKVSEKVEEDKHSKYILKKITLWEDHIIWKKIS